MQDTPQDAAIDAVLTWVDGDDPAHRARLEAHLASVGRRPQAAAATRFRSVGEIDYCISSLLRFAPFLRRIFIITDAQRPPLLGASPRWPQMPRDKLVVVDHREIFAGLESLLPTFNSRSIETLLHRVPGLSEHFVYLNDDFMLLRPVTPQDWFRGGLPVLRGDWRPQPDRTLKRRLRNTLARITGRPPSAARASYRDGQARAGQVAGFAERYYHSGHHPHPIRRSTLERFFAEHPALLQSNAAHRLRSAEQFLTTSLAHHLELRAGSFHQAERPQIAYLKPASTPLPALQRELTAAAKDEDQLFLCVQSLDEAPPAAQQALLQWLDAHLAPSATVPAGEAQSLAKS